MWDKVGTKKWRRPLLLRGDNFTPAPRTPWGGRRIVEELKAGEGLTVRGAVGEAWELSVEPDFPSRLVEGPLLDEVLRAEPALLGEEASLGSTALLVKLVDAARWTTSSADTGWRYGKRRPCNAPKSSDVPTTSSHRSRV